MGAVINSKNAGCIGVIGPGYSFLTVASAILADIIDITLLSNAASSTELTDRATYPNFTRVVPPDSQQARALVDLALFYGWYNASIVSTTEAYGLSLSAEFIKSAARKPITIGTYQQFVPELKI